MSKNATKTSPTPITLPLKDFGQLQTHYQSLRLVERAKAILQDATPALQTMEHILETLSTDKAMEKMLGNIQKNPLFTGKMRPSEAKTSLMDGEDFLATIRRKLAAWRKTMERLAKAEDIVSDNGKDHIPADAPLALAIMGNGSMASYLSIMQIALNEIAKKDANQAATYQAMVASVRRASTILGDCELAADLRAVIL